MLGTKKANQNNFTSATDFNKITNCHPSKDLTSGDLEMGAESHRMTILAIVTQNTVFTASKTRGVSYELGWILIIGDTWNV